MADSQDIDQALIAKLGSDAALLALCPNGVYPDEAPPNMTRFVIVSLIDEADTSAFGGRAIEDALFLVEARMRSNVAGIDPKAAAARIDALLENAVLVVAGFKTMTVQRESRIRMTEPDDADPSIRWYRRGGNYRVQMSVS